MFWILRVDYNRLPRKINAHQGRHGNTFWYRQLDPKGLSSGSEVAVFSHQYEVRTDGTEEDQRADNI
jgi:hypothetical protein